MLRTCLILSSIASITMKTPVRPTPALERNRTTKRNRNLLLEESTIPSNKHRSARQQSPLLVTSCVFVNRRLWITWILIDWLTRWLRFPILDYASSITSWSKQLTVCLLNKQLYKTTSSTPGKLFVYTYHCKAKGRFENDHTLIRNKRIMKVIMQTVIAILAYSVQ